MHHSKYLDDFKPLSWPAVNFIFECFPAELVTKGAALPKSCGLCLPCVPESRSANAQSIRRASGYWLLLSLRYCRSQRMPFAVIYKNKAESLFTILPPFIIIEDLRIYRVFFTHSYLSSVLDYYFSKSIVLSNSLICSTLNHSVLLPEL